MKLSKYISKQSKKASCCMGKSSIIDDVIEDDEPPLVDSGRTQKTGRISRTNKTDNIVLGETADGLPFHDDGIIIDTKPPSCSPSRRNSRPKRVPSIDLQDDSQQFRVSLGSSRRPSSDCSTRRPSLCSSMGSMRSLQAYSQHTTTAPAPSGQCPYRHGTVYTDPYPGYIHGNPKRGICPNGCRPEMNTQVMSDESPNETMLREAIEFIQLYYHERGDEMKGKEGFISKEKRLDEIKRSIVTTGTYEHTFDELQHGARVAWRNAPKCSNRKYWADLKLLDQRKVTTNKGMYDACIQHLSKAMSSGVSESYITVFKPATTNSPGPRIWNDQLLSYASWRSTDDEGIEGDEIIGDAKNLRFTEMLQERFGWNGPKHGAKGKYDYLPLVIQADPQGPPELFEVPPECAPPVQIHHPRYPELGELNLQWYPIPAVCALDLTVGGILYTAVPFNGWYATTEVLRDLVDESRYNMLIPIANALGMNTDLKPGEAPLWKDEVMQILSSAIYHSFKTSNVGMIDHHSLIDMFWDWYTAEMKSRKYCPANWKWVIPPMSSSTNKAYLGLHKAQEYTLKPAYLFGASPFQLETNYFGSRDTSKAMSKLIHCVYMAMLFKRVVKRIRGRKQPVLIIYASVTGNAAKYASELGSILASAYNVSFFDACGVSKVDVGKLIETATLTIFVTSTMGNGELPSQSRKFFSTLFDEPYLVNKQCAVLGFGSRNYPIFCGAATEISRRLRKIGAKEVIQRGECDAVQGESSTFYDWTLVLVSRMASTATNPLIQQLANNMKENTLSSLVRSHSLLDSVKVEVFTTEEVEHAAAALFMSKRRGSGGTMGSSARRLSTAGTSGRRLSMDAGSSSRSVDPSLLALDSSGRRRSTGEAPTKKSSPRSPRASFTSTAALTTSSTTFDVPTSIDVVEKVGLPLLTTSSSMDERIMVIIGSSGQHGGEDVLSSHIISREDLIGSTDEDEATTRKTSLIKIDLKSSPYHPGDHIYVYPRNIIDIDQLETFVSHLSRVKEAGGRDDDDMNLTDNIYVSFENDTPKSELKVMLPLLYQSLGSLMPLDYFFETQVALESPISQQACLDLSQLATSSKDIAVLTNIGNNKREYDDLHSLCGLKWIDMFKTFPSLSKKVTINFLLCNCKINHPRSYSIASCKDVVGSELHIVVGRLLYSRGGSKQEVGVCSNFLTHIEPGDEILFKIESAPSFRYPVDPICPIIFICTGTGYSPMRGLLQKRSYLKSQGQQLGPAFMIFGSRSSEEGLFHNELEAFENEGVLTKTWMCYSREPNKKKEYTTTKIRSPKVRDVISPLLAKSNTHIYICGSANMAEVCKTALRDLSPQASDFDDIVEGNRLHLDVFGARTSSRITHAKKRVSSYTLGEDELYLSTFDDVNLESSIRSKNGRGNNLTSSCIIGGNDIQSMLDNLQMNDTTHSGFNSSGGIDIKSVLLESLKHNNDSAHKSYLENLDHGCDLDTSLYRGTNFDKTRRVRAASFNESDSRGRRMQVSFHDISISSRLSQDNNLIPEGTREEEKDTTVLDVEMSDDSSGYADFMAFLGKAE